VAAKPKKRRRARRPVKRVPPTGLLAWGAKRHPVAFRLVPEIIDGLDHAANVNGMTRNKLVEAVLYEYVEGRPPTEKEYAKENPDDLFS
jgi:hypothetical protein